MCRPEMLEALRRRASGGSVLAFDAFVETALYEPGIGYYRSPLPRIGFGPGTDFRTASDSPLFGRLVAEAAKELLGARNPGEFTFVEVGAEGGRSVLDQVAHPFSGVRLVGIGDSLRIEGPSVVFSNELFDAQPFRRFRHRRGVWVELGVDFSDGTLCLVELPAPDPLPGWLPREALEGYVIDAPVAAARLAERIAAEPWNGLFLAFDYGKSWEALASEAPEGTARAYYRHTQTNDLLARPGEQDLTCHICWDWIRSALGAAGFEAPVLESQEAFLVRHAAPLLSSLAQSEAGRLSRDKLSLLQLLHPANMGQKFQALWARRP